MMSDSINTLQKQLAAFAAERRWEQFHTPKNLAMALTGEVGELVEVFQWMTPEESAAIMGSSRRADVTDEIADVAIYLLRLADVLGIDLAQAVQDKMARNEDRFPPP